MSTFFSKFKIGVGATELGLGGYAAFLGFSATTLGPAIPIACFCFAVLGFGLGASNIYEGREELRRGPR